MLIAQQLNIPGGSVEGPLNRPDQPQFTNLASVVTQALTFVFPIAGILLLAYLVWGGFEFLTSMGDEKQMQAAKGKITNALIGFTLIFLAYWIVQIVDKVFKLGVYS